MKHALFSFLALLCLSPISWAQGSLQRPTFAAGGNSNNQFTFTLGEAVATFDTAATGSLSIGAQPGDEKKGSGTRDQQTLTGITLFPNPTEGLLWVQVEADPAQELLGSVFDVAGRQLFDCTLRSGLQSLDLCGQPAGNYILRLRTATQSGTWVIIKH